MQPFQRTTFSHRFIFNFKQFRQSFTAFYKTHPDYFFCKFFKISAREILFIPDSIIFRESKSTMKTALRKRSTNLFRQKCVSVSHPLKNVYFSMGNVNNCIIFQKTKDKHQSKFSSWAFPDKKILLDQLACSAKSYTRCRTWRRFLASKKIDWCKRCKFHLDFQNIRRRA